MDRRLFLTYVGSSTAALVAASSGIGALTGNAMTGDHLQNGQPSGRANHLLHRSNQLVVHGKTKWYSQMGTTIRLLLLMEM